MTSLSAAPTSTLLPHQSAVDELANSFERLDLRTRYQWMHGVLDCVYENARVWMWNTSYHNIRHDDSWDHVFLIHGRDARGNTLLIASACFEDATMVDWLLKNGAELHAANLDGRTALMEASLWGRLDNVGVLLKGETNRRQRDREGNSALDLAMQSESNSRRRYLRSGKEGIIERPWKDDQDRRKIVELLSPDVATFVNESGSNLPLFDRSLGGERTNLVLKQFLTMRDPEQKRQKTVVRLVDGLLTIDAMSGWKHNDKYTIPGDVTEVLRFAEAIGFSFAPDKQSSMRFSDGSPVDERYYASHAEPQAIVQYLRLMDLGLDIDLAHQQQLSTKQSNLREVQLIVSNKICPKCAEFMARINSLAMSSAGFQLVAWERFMDENGKLVSTKQIWP